MLRNIAERVIGGYRISREDALLVCSVEGGGILELFNYASEIRQKFRPPVVDLCSIVSAKSGACSEDCSYCAQSRISRAGVKATKLLRHDAVVESARAAKGWGARRFCIVTSGRKPSPAELDAIARMVSEIRDLGLLPCATLGMLDAEELRLLRDAGLNRYHHNLETSRRMFPEICTTHTYGQKLETVGAAKAAGLSVCSGGIFGLGEDWADRVDLAFELRGLDVDSIAVNFLVPIEGTPLGGRTPLEPLEALKIVSLYRFVLPEREVRVCGGRLQTLGGLNHLVIQAGADGLLTGDCLTVEGHSAEDDLRMIRQYGLGVSGGTA